MTNTTPTQDDVTRVHERVRVFDTSLRDGEQAPGFSMNRAQKVRIAQALAALGVDVIEAGFPQASAGDFDAVRAVATHARGPIICALARAQFGDIEAAARATEPAKRARVHIFLATSPIHRLHKLNMNREQVLETGIKAVRRARELFDDVEFSAEDALRTEPEFLVEVLSAVIAAGANTVNVPDTVGYTTPAEIGALFARLKREVRGVDNVILSAHCHNDLGLGVANSLAALAAGARQVECTIAGIGERAGNAALEEVVMALRTRADYFHLDTGIHTPLLYPTARLLSDLVGVNIPRNKAVVGENAFAHESGIHQHGMLKNRETYEIMRPEDVGFARTQLVLGKHSGRHALRERLLHLGHDLDDALLNDVFTRFKALADLRGEVGDGDIDALAQGFDPDAPGPWTLESLHASSHLSGGSSGSVKLRHADGRVSGEAAIGDSCLQAVLRAMQRAVGFDLDIADFQLHTTNLSADAHGTARLTVRHDGRELCGRGSAADLVEATAMAALQIVNRIERVCTPHPVAAIVANHA